MIRKTVVLSFLGLALTGHGLAAAPQWVEVLSPHFTAVSDTNEKQARHVLDQLERMRWVFEKLYPKANVDPAEPILVIAAKNSKTFQAFEPEEYLGKGKLNLAGFFLSSQDHNYVLLRLDAEEDQNPYATIYHEYTHLQFRSLGEFMPLWLNEGIAQFFQNTKVRDKDVRVGQANGDQILYLRQQRLIPLPVLFKIDASSPYYHEEEKGSVFYAESWALTHYLEITDREKGTYRLQDYIRLASQHEDPVAAAEKAFGNLKQLQSSLESYIQSGQYKEFVLNSAAAPIDESSYTAHLLTAVQADAVRAEILASVHREKEARELIDSVLKADPQNAQVRQTLGQIELHAGRLEEARSLYRESIKLAPDSYLANFYFASISMQSGHVGDDAIEPSLRSAIKENPKFAPAYERLAVYLSIRNEDKGEAFSLIKTAVKLDPGNFYFRLNAATVLMNMGRYADASAVLGAAVKLAREPGQVAQVQTQIESLNRMQEAKARMEQNLREHASSQVQPNAPAEVREITVTEAPKHPDEANGPRHSIQGVIRDVTCSYPSVLVFRLEAAGKNYALYNNNFVKIDLTALGFTPTEALNPCTGLDGFKARIQYAESTDKSVDGKVLAIELHK